jgi:proline dehydrogenase
MRRILLWAARNRWLREHLSRAWFVRRAVRRFMPGEELSDALRAADAHASSGIGSVFTLLGENLSAIEEAERVAAHYHEVLDAITARGLRGEISVKLTQLGLDIDPGATFRLLEELVAHARRTGETVWVDMEGSAYTDATVDLYERAVRANQNVGLCLQAYLHRTPADVDRLLPLGPSIRLVKGAYDEPAEIAIRGSADVDQVFRDIGERLVDALATDSARRVILGTHDTTLIDALARHATAKGVDRSRLEIQMLYGIRADEQRRLAAEGFDVRCLIAYGSYWYPWYMRRLAERPANVLFALRQLLP